MSNTRKIKPPPGLRGDYSGTCIACLEPTDTGLAFRGEAEWLMAGLTVLGIPEDEASAIYRQRHGSDLAPGQVQAGVHSLTIRVCARCVEKCPAPFPAPALAIPGAELPTVGQPGAVA